MHRVSRDISTDSRTQTQIFSATKSKSAAVGHSLLEEETEESETKHVGLFIWSTYSSAPEFLGESRRARGGGADRSKFFKGGNPIEDSFFCAIPRSLVPLL